MRNFASTLTFLPARPTKSLALCAAAALFALAASSASAAPALVNGSLTGPLAFSSPPPGWSIVAVTPDTADQTHNTGTGTPAQYIAPASASPDGGTFVTIGASPAYGPAPSDTEAFGQKVNGFTIGKSYTLTWYHANFGAVYDFLPQYPLDASNAIKVLADGITIGSGTVLGVGPGWVEESISFIAADTELDLTFTSFEIAGTYADGGSAMMNSSYQAIDGIRLTETPVIPPTNNVPEPAALSLFSGAGLAALLASRRRKQAKQAAAA